jgi:asparagine synthase (glutamine-hydrolysing)
MSGIAGIVHFDGAPVDRQLLVQMTGSMAFRGPDAHEIWIDRNVGFGHTLLKTTDESEHERQPFTLDGQLWIVADARVDARRNLIPKLWARGHENLPLDATDVELILRAYQTWGERCVEHLLGDFAFAIWDSPRQRLFCGRDHLGVKPFFYARIGHTLIFSNTMDCIRQHPSVSGRLNDLAIADFLLFDLNQDLATTSFADIQRLPPAHSATWSFEATELRRYWTFPIDQPLNFHDDDEYVDRFNDLLEQAVDDRLRTKRVGVFMSGGLDSPALAASASRILCWRSSDSEVHAFTTVIDGFDGNERYYAGLVARHLGIPITFHDLTGNVIDPAWAETSARTPEPVVDPMNLVADRREYQLASEYSRVWLFGEGPDNALRNEWKAYLSYSIRKRHFGRLARNAWELVVRSRRIPFLRSILSPLKNRWQGQSEKAGYPQWLNQDFASRLHLRERWAEHERTSALSRRHPLRPEAYRSFEGPMWEHLFSQCDAAALGSAVEMRHPFVDLRLLRFMFAVPALPWCRDKYLMRRALRSVLPVPVLKRPKTPLTGDPQWEAALSLGLPPLDPTLTLTQYVDTSAVPERANRDMMSFWADLRPRALDYWLRNLPASIPARNPRDEFQELEVEKEEQDRHPEPERAFRVAG